MWNSIINRTGFSVKLISGYAGVLIFMTGEGLEQGWLSPYLISKGLTIQQTSLLFSVYGMTAAVAAWYSGVLTEIWGASQVMLAGLLLFITGSILFLSVGLPHYHLTLMLPTYALRGLGYPLFAYGFLVWVTYEAPAKYLGSAVGIFWFVYTGGLNVLGVLYSSMALPYLGEINTLWSALIFVFAGAIIAICLNRKNQPVARKTVTLSYLFKGIAIAFEQPKVGLGGVVRTINTTGAYGFAVFMPTVMMDLGFSRTDWLHMYSTLFAVNIIFNLIFGLVSDKLGWRNVVIWFGCIGCALTTLLFFYIPHYFPGHYWLTMIAAGIFGACLAAFVPLSAIMPSLVPDNKGAAMSILNLGAGLSTFTGPAIVGIVIGSVGATGVIWIYTALYVLGAVLMKFVTPAADSSIPEF